MGLVIVISLPLILFAILLGFGCYFLGRAKGRAEARAGLASQVYGAPVPPPCVLVSSPPPMSHVNKEGPESV